MKKPEEKMGKNTKKESAGKTAKKTRKAGNKKKGLIVTLLVLVILIAAVIVYLMCNLDFLVKTAIEKYGSQATQTAVRVKGVHISLKKGSASIEGLTIANPDGFETPHAFSLGEIGVDIDLKSLTSDEIGMDDIVIRSPIIFVEVNGDNKNNLNELKKNLPDDGGATSRSPAKKNGGEEKSLFFRRILFTGGRIYAKVVPMNNKEYQLAMPAVEMRNLRGTPKQIAAQVISRLTRQALDEVKKKGIDQAVDKVGDQAKSQLDAQKKKAGEKLKKGLGL